MRIKKNQSSEREPERERGASDGGEARASQGAQHTSSCCFLIPGPGGLQAAQSSSSSSSKKKKKIKMELARSDGGGQ